MRQTGKKGKKKKGNITNSFWAPQRGQKKKKGRNGKYKFSFATYV